MFKHGILAAAGGLAAFALPSVASADPHNGGHGRSQVRVVVGSPHASGYNNYGAYYSPYAGYNAPYVGNYGAYAPGGAYPSYGGYNYGYGYGYASNYQSLRQHRRAERHHMREHQRHGY